MSVAPEYRPALVAVVQAKGLLRLDEPVQLSSGQWSDVFIDVKRALAAGFDLRLACEAITETVRGIGVDFDAVGGMTMGADHLAHGIALVAGCDWFVVRKQAKGRGTNKRVEGVDLLPGVRVLLVEDAVTTGRSIQEAYEVVVGEGATVVAAATMVDRGDMGRAFFEERDIPYLPLLTYEDLGIPPLAPV